MLEPEPALSYQLIAESANQEFDTPGTFEIFPTENKLENKP